MKKTILLATSLIAISLFIISGCSKKGSTTPTPPPPVVETEENIVFAIDPDPGSSTAPATSGTYTFKLTVSSKLPASGYTVDYTTKKDSDNSELEKKQISSSVASVDISTGTLASGVLYNVTLLVTSKSKSTNTATKTFKVARK